MERLSHQETDKRPTIMLEVPRILDQRTKPNLPTHERTTKPANHENSARDLSTSLGCLPFHRRVVVGTHQQPISHPSVFLNLNPRASQDETPTVPNPTSPTTPRAPKLEQRFSTGQGLRGSILSLTNSLVRFHLARTVDPAPLLPQNIQGP